MNRLPIIGAVLVSLCAIGAVFYDATAIHRTGPQSMSGSLNAPAICFADGGCMTGPATGAAPRRCATDEHDILVYHLDRTGDSGFPTDPNSGAGDPTDAGTAVDSNYLATRWGTDPTQIETGVIGLFGLGWKLDGYNGFGTSDNVGRPGAGGYTVSFWAASNAVGGGGGCTNTFFVSAGPVAWEYNSGDGNIRVWYNSTGYGSQSAIITNSPSPAWNMRESLQFPPPLAKWQFWAISWSTAGTGTLNVYRSVTGGGTLDIVKSITGASNPLPVGRLSIGRPWDEAANMCGVIGRFDEIRVANIARTKEQLETCYRQAVGYGDFP